MDYKNISTDEQSPTRFFILFSYQLQKKILSYVFLNATLTWTCHNLTRICHNLTRTCHNLTRICHNLTRSSHNFIPNLSQLNPNLSQLNLNLSIYSRNKKSFGGKIPQDFWNTFENTMEFVSIAKVRHNCYS